MESGGEGGRRWRLHSLAGGRWASLPLLGPALAKGGRPRMHWRSCSPGPVVGRGLSPGDPSGREVGQSLMCSARPGQLFPGKELALGLDPGASPPPPHRAARGPCCASVGAHSSDDVLKHVQIWHDVFDCQASIFFQFQVFKWPKFTALITVEF